MPERSSPLTTVLVPGQHGAPSSKGSSILLGEQPITSLTQIAGWQDFEAEALPGLKSLGFSDAGDYRQSRTSGSHRLFRIAPDRLWITSTTATKLPDSLAAAPDTLAILDLSHSRTALVVDGSASEHLMARLAPIDWRLQEMPPGDFVQTSIHHVAVLVCRTDTNRFEIIAPVTWARSIWEYICINAAPFGYEVRTAPA